MPRWSIWRARLCRCTWAPCSFTIRRRRRAGRSSFSQILANLERRMDAVAVFRRRVERVPLDLDHPWWVDDGPADLGYHVSRLALPAPADWREFCGQVAHYLERPLDMSRPPWEMLFIEGLDTIEGMPKGAFALVHKMHHSAMDGVSGMEFIGCLHDQEPTPTSTPRTDLPSRQPESPSAVELLLRALPNAVQNPLRILEAVVGLGPALSRRVLATQTDIELEPAASAKVPRTRFDGSVGPHRTVGGVRFDLADIKQVKNAVPAATVNDAVMALVGGGLRHYLNDAHELPTDSLVALMPISLREGDSDGLGNKLAYTTIPLGTDIDDPIERVRRLHEMAAKKKAVQNGENARRLIQIADAVPAGLLGLAGRLAAQLDLSNKVSAMNITVTNVPGPGTPIYLTGAEARGHLRFRPRGEWPWAGEHGVQLRRVVDDRLSVRRGHDAVTPSVMKHACGARWPNWSTRRHLPTGTDLRRCGSQETRASRARGAQVSDIGFWTAAAQSHPARIAVVDDRGRETSFGELFANQNRLANGLRALGLGAGDCVAALLWNQREFLELALAAAQTGLYFLPINWHLTAPEIAYILADRGAAMCSLTSGWDRSPSRRLTRRSCTRPDGWRSVRSRASDAYAGVLFPNSRRLAPLRRRGARRCCTRRGPRGGPRAFGGRCRAPTPKPRWLRWSRSCRRSWVSRPARACSW